MSFSDISAAAITAWAALVSAISTPFVAIFLYFMGRKVQKIGEQTDGMGKAMIEMAKKDGERVGSDKATAVAEVKADALAKGQAIGRAEGRPPQSVRKPGE